MSEADFPATFPDDVPEIVSGITIHRLGLRPYTPTWQAMRGFTDARTEDTPDALWLLQHPPVYTMGQAGRAEHILDAGETPVVQSDRGGQVTWHGPGQIVAYVLVDLHRRGIGVRRLVTALEESVIRLLADHGISALARPEAPGVYVEGRKVAALGLRVRRGCSYHGLALNVENNLEPFTRINPCGYAGLEATRLRDLGVTTLLERLEDSLAAHVGAALDEAARR